MGGVTFLIPANTENDEATVIVKNDSKNLRPQIKLKDLPFGWLIVRKRGLHKISMYSVRLLPDFLHKPSKNDGDKA